MGELRLLLFYTAMLLVVPRTQCAPHRKTGISLFDHLTGEYVTYTTHRHRVYSATTDISLPALFVYDFLCTFEEEKEVIWKRRFSGPSFLYVALRLFTAGYILLQILINLVPGDINVSPQFPPLNLCSTYCPGVWS